MYRLISLFAVFTLVCGIVSAGEEKKADESAAIKEKAAALIEEQDSRVDKLVTLQKFVRDNIREIKTQYG